MTDTLRLGIAGLGTVGVGVIKIVRQQADLLSKRTGKNIAITAVCARNRDKDRGVPLSGYDWEDDPVALAQRDDVDVFIELMGGSDGPAKAATEAAITAGKHVVTANKAMLAIHGQALALAAEERGVNLRYEAAVAGGIPIIKSLAEGLAGNEIKRVLGVMNGTCNYILTRMEATRQGYNVLFQECADLGYLEADPNLDVGGIDAAHKLALLSSIAFGTQVDFEGIEIEGIERVTLDDIQHASDMGYRIKLLGVAQKTGRGLEQRMMPCLVPASSALGVLEGGTNAVVVDGNAVEQIVLRGPGAGEGPTASAVLGDICDIARGVHIPVFGQPATSLEQAPSAKSVVTAPHYLRLSLTDKPGALAKVAAVLGEAGVSIDRMRQREHEGDVATVIIVTHACARGDLDQALGSMGATGVVQDDPIVLRIEAV